MSDSKSADTILEEDVDDDRPVFQAGELIESQDGHFSFRIEDLLGEGRCCLVYSAHAIGDDSRVALKFFKRGDKYEGAIQREIQVLSAIGVDGYHNCNIVSCYGYFRYKTLHCQVLELLDFNIRQVIFQNNRKGLRPWAVQKFAKDMLVSLRALHSRGYTHADLKPANVMWSSNEGCFKLFDFGLSFHKDEYDLHQIQTKGYQAPEAAYWNEYKEEQKKCRKRKLQGNFFDFDELAQSGKVIENLNRVKETNDETKDEDTSCPKTGPVKQSWPSQSSGIYTASTCLSPVDSLADADDLETSELCETIPEESIGQRDEPTSSRHSTIISEKVKLPADTSEQFSNWREGRRRQRMRMKELRQPKAPVRPRMPSASVDMWSLGCILFEVITGSKLFKAGDKLASVLRPKQLIEMKVGETEMRYSEEGHPELFEEMKDFVIKCLEDNPEDRISSDSSFEHNFIKRQLTPSLVDMILLPTNVLKLVDVLESSNSDDVEEMLSDIRNEVEQYGRVSDVKVHKKHVFVEFQEARHCLSARGRLLGRSFNDRLIFPVFYPKDCWRRQFLDI